MTDYLITIGLEIHLKLNSQTKIFCRCKNEQDFNIQPNTNICPVCTGQPWALPLLSQEVVDKAILFGKALNADIQPVISFDRKNYFYPDLPMGFQITQFYHPIIKDGEVKYFINNYEEEKTVHIHEAHLECDTAKMIHEGTGKEGKSLLDFNRAGTPLLEIVTDPDFTSAEEVVEYAKTIQRIARRNGLGDADLEKGQMRVDVNISIREKADQPLNKKVEMKNINSFGAMKRAVESEYERQKAILESWNTRPQESRRWEDTKGYSFSMRSKEDVEDYRYFPEPDMPVLRLNNPSALSGTSPDREENYIKKADWETQFTPLSGGEGGGRAKSRTTEEGVAKQSQIFLPYTYIKICKDQFGFNKEFINALLLDKPLFDFFFAEVEKGFEAKTVAKRLVGGKQTALADFPADFPQRFEDFLQREKEKNLLDNQLKIVFEELLQTGKSVEEIVKEKGFDTQAVDDNALATIVKEVLDANPTIVEQYKGGKETTIGFFVGQVMKKTWGKVNPQTAQEELKKQLG